MATVFDRVRNVVVDRLGVDADDVAPESSFVDDLNADSLDIVELVMGFEEEFSTDDNPIKIPDEDAEKIRTIQDAIDFIKGKGVSD